MALLPKIDKNLLDTINKDTQKEFKKITSNQKVLADRILTTQENQVEFEKYLKDILKRLDKINNKLLELTIKSDKDN